MDVAAPGPSTVIPFYVDRPFIFLIKEKSTGVILFMGKVTKL
jgi:serpin B